MGDENNSNVQGQEEPILPIVVNVDLHPVGTGLASSYTTTINTNSNELMTRIEELVGKINAAISDKIYPDMAKIPQVIIAAAGSEGEGPTRTDGSAMQTGDLWFEVITDTPVPPNNEE